ncbi:8dfd2cad-decc-4415-947d-e226751924ee [Sclerotinia trifoliorum]|uniref:8dfd2cad-decc-4415-947d-e226751924ee n=1 Tax=Sclerotinia trifoliorum TaxID=28548 RepID=A0A8H2VLS2_9HELO|nr:8dfd2cad-decc-4415-947d-e226751924ee [Sclerotinia trifoliorum]
MEVNDVARKDTPGPAKKAEVGVLVKQTVKMKELTFHPFPKLAREIRAACLKRYSAFRDAWTVSVLKEVGKEPTTQNAKHYFGACQYITLHGSISTGTSPWTYLLPKV